MEFNHLACRLIEDEEGRVATELYCVETGKPIAGVVSTSLEEGYDYATVINIKMHLFDKNGKKFTCTMVNK